MNFHKPGLHILLLGFILLYSCDCVYDYHFVVENKTSSKIYVYCKGGYYDSFINRTDSISKDTMGYVLNIERYFAEGGCPGPAYEDGNGFIDSIYIYKNDSTHTILNYKNYKKWGFARTKDDGYFKITLQDKDFITTKQQ
jgi:hypothetical protein